jgi:hypothetical protein
MHGLGDLHEGGHDEQDGAEGGEHQQRPAEQSTQLRIEARAVRGRRPGRAGGKYHGAHSSVSPRSRQMVPGGGAERMVQRAVVVGRENRFPPECSPGLAKAYQTV